MEPNTLDKVQAAKANYKPEQLYNGDFLQISVDLSPEEDGSDVATAYLTKPNRTTLGAIMSQLSKNPVLAWEVTLKNTIVKEISDMRVLEDDSAFMASMSALDSVVSIRKADLKKI